MASTYSPKLKFELIGAGEQAGLWGTTTNKNIGELIEQAIAGVTTVDLTGLSGDYTLSSLDGTVDQARSAVISCTGTATAAVNIIIPTSTKLYVFRNACGKTITIKTASQVGGVVLANGEANSVFCNGAIALAGLVTAGAGTTPVSGGGTGQTSFTAGFVVSPTPGGTTALTTVPSISLSGDTSGILPIAKGGTGITTAPTSGQLLIGTSAGGYTPATLTQGSGITITNSSGGITISTSGGAGITSVSGSATVTASTVGTSVTVSQTSSQAIAALGYTPYNSSNPSGYITSSGVAFLSNSGTQTFAGSINAQSFQAQGAGSVGDQKITVNYSGYSSGMAPASCQVARGGTGILYDTSSRFVGFINNGSSLSISPPDAVGYPANTLYTSGVDAYKGGSSTSWLITSDARIKKNVTPYTKGLAELNQVQIKNYEFNGLAGTQDGKKGLGIIADEIQQVLPDTVGTSKVKLNPDDAEPVDLKHFDSTEFVYLLINSVKELSTKVDAQAAEIAELKAKL